MNEDRCKWPRCSTESTLVSLRGGHRFPLCEKHWKAHCDQHDNILEQLGRFAKLVQIDYAKGLNTPRLFRRCKLCGDFHGPYSTVKTALRAAVCERCQT